MPKLDISFIRKMLAFENTLREEIMSGIYEPGSRLPSPMKLSARYKVPVVNIISAEKKLEKEGFLVSYKGKGTYVMRMGHIRTAEHVIGVISADNSALTSHRIVNGIERIITANGYGIILRNSRDSQAKEEKILREMISAKAEGIIIEPSKSQTLCKHMNLYRLLDERNIPYVFMRSSYPQMIDSPKIKMDDIQGAYLVTRHLIATGRTNIVGFFKTDDAVGAERHTGYVKALQEAGIYYNPELVIWFHSEDVLKKPELALEQLFKKNIGFDAVMCYSDAMAANVMLYLKKKEKKVPAEVSITGYDNSFVSPAGDVGLTTIVEPLELLGEMTAQLLLEKMAGISEEESQVERILHPDLIIRGSTIGTNI